MTCDASGLGVRSKSTVHQLDTARDEPELGRWLSWKSNRIPSFGVSLDINLLKRTATPLENYIFIPLRSRETGKY